MAIAASSARTVASARSRRGWNMTSLLPELEHGFPRDVQLDGELVAFDQSGRPDFHRLGERMLLRRGNAAVTFMVFDLLARNGRHARIVPTFSDGNELFAAMCERDL